MVTRKEIDISEIKKEFNKEYKLRADVLNVVLDTIGDDTTVYTVIKNSLGKLSESEIRDLTVEDIISFLPKKKGEVAPWELIRAVFMKDITKYYLSMIELQLIRIRWYYYHYLETSFHCLLSISY